MFLLLIGDFLHIIVDENSNSVIGNSVNDRGEFLDISSNVKLNVSKNCDGCVGNVETEEKNQMNEHKLKFVDELKALPRVRAKYELPFVFVPIMFVSMVVIIIIVIKWKIN